MAYTVSAAGLAGVRLGELTPPTSSPIVMSLTIFGRAKGFLDKKLLL